MPKLCLPIFATLLESIDLVTVILRKQHTTIHSNTVDAIFGVFSLAENSLTENQKINGQQKRFMYIFKL